MEYRKARNGLKAAFNPLCANHDKMGLALEELVTLHFHFPCSLLSFPPIKIFWGNVPLLSNALRVEGG